MPDKRIECVDCDRTFTWTSGEQRFYAEKRLQPPKRCSDCRAHRRAARDPGMHGTLPPAAPLPLPRELRATADRLSGRSAPPARQRHVGGLTARFGAVTFGLALLATLALHTLIADWIFDWLIAITVVTFLTYGYDKIIASSTRMRVPEVVLLGLAIAGGTLGAIAGMRVFHHKTAKDSFQLKFVLIVIGQIVVISVYYVLTRR